jgi:ketosteroid isomerase-like protein
VTDVVVAVRDLVGAASRTHAGARVGVFSSGMSDDLGTRFVRAVAARDEAALGACFVPDVEFRALTPPGLRERKGAVETAALYARWFGDSTDLRLLHSSGDEVGNRLHLSYRLGGVEEGQPYVVEHHLFCTVSNGKIERADLLCSGFHPPAPTST